MIPLAPYKVAVVTGAFGLLGRQHTMALREIGYKVYALDNSQDKLLSFNSFVALEDSHKNMVIPLIVDLRSEDEIRKAIETIYETEGRIDSIINNAAHNPVPSISKLSELVESFDVDVWNEEVQVGLTSAILLAKHAIPYMQTGGCIVNIASDLAVIAPDQRVYKSLGKDKEGNYFVKPLSYSVIKTGILGFTRYLSTYLAPRAIRVNALSPGGVYVGQHETLVCSIENLIPLGRMANIAEYRGAIQFLCSDASSYMTGQNLIVDGGRSVW